MRLCRYGPDRLGVIEGDQVVDVTRVLHELPAVRWPFPREDAVIARLPQLRDAMVEAAKSGAKCDLDGIFLRSPVASPTKVVAAPVNYSRHVAEAKAASAIAGNSRGNS